MLLLGLGVLLGAETDDRQQVLDLTEHALLDHFADLLVTRPGRVLALVAGARSKRKLHDFITEILWIRDTGRLFRLRQFGVEDLAVEHLAGVGVLVVLLLDPGVGIGDIAIEQILAVFAVGFDIGLLDFAADEFGVARRQHRLDEVEITLLHLLRMLFALHGLFQNIHQMHWIGCNFVVVVVESLGENLECEPGRNARHALGNASRLAIFLD